MSEAQLQASVIELATLRGWMCAHFRAARSEKGWRTPVAGDGKGFPDCVLLRWDRLVFAELKAARGRLSREQVRWLEALREVPTEVYCWTPADWTSGEIRKVLW